MFWNEDDEAELEYQAPDDVFDLMFKLRGSRLDIDHAYALAQALKNHLNEATCGKIGVHGIRMAESGNGWNRPDQIDASQPLSRRARLEIRVHRDDSDAVRQISNQTLQIGGQQVEIGTSSIRKLSTIGTLHARAVYSDREQSEADFLEQIAAGLKAMNIRVSKMICGKSRDIRVDQDNIFTRALLVANLKPEESVILQQQGIGDGRLLGCGLFVPHRGIDAVYSMQE